MRLDRALSILIMADVGLSLLSVMGAEPAPTRLQAFLFYFVVATTLLAWVGLVLRLTVGRVVYLVSWLVYLALIALRTPAPAAGPAEALQLLMALNGGAILGIAWLSDLGGRFTSLAQAFGGAPRAAA
ncbi:MAG TPA: hypothetical protein VJV75_06985 [Candidatus Polarisedimenticolia bacterium]|nr:hypothetical protein [Candidatus Polarisedimenticolia bacterium]